MIMDKNRVVTAFLTATILTALAVYKRYFYFQTQHEFTLEFGKSLLSPLFLIFFVCSALSLTFPLNFQVGKEAYREATGYYRFLRARKRFTESLKRAPIGTLAATDATKIAKYLDLPLWIAEKLTSVMQKTILLKRHFLYAFWAATTLLTTITPYVLWKIFKTINN